VIEGARGHAATFHHEASGDALGYAPLLLHDFRPSSFIARGVWQIIDEARSIVPSPSDAALIVRIALASSLGIFGMLRAWIMRGA